MGAKASHSQFDLRRTSVPQRRCEPFRDSEEAWFWTMAALMARARGPATPPTKAGSCAPASLTTW